MILKRGGYDLLRILSYILLLSLLILVRGNHNVQMIHYFILVLLFIANSVGRLFTFRKSNLFHHMFFYLSILAELILGTILSRALGWHSFILFFITILDVGYTSSKAVATCILSIILGYGIFLELWHNPEVSILVMNLVGIISFSILAVYMKEEEVKKIKAQELYDRLRVSEDRLGQAYKELEMYANTVEELTLLRERTRVSRELHDSVGHALSALYIQLKAVKTLVHKSPEQAEQMLELNSNYVHDTLQDVRNTVHRLKPKEFEGAEGLFIIEEMVKNYKAMTGVDIRFILSKEKGIMTSEQGQQLYRIIQEALNNAVNHGKAKQIQISIQFKIKELYVYIKDDGVGCHNLKEGFGLVGMKERVTALGGHITFNTERDRGFEIQLTVPRFAQTVNEAAL